MRIAIITPLILVCCMLVGCHPYQPNIQQGNFITQKMLSQIQVGMSKQQVANILGFPVLENAFSEDNWSYVYTFQRSGGKVAKKSLNIAFLNNRVVRITGDYPPF